jgi:hypothetical protein
MQHKGEIVERAVRQSGFPLTQLTKRLGKSRRWIYDAFLNANLSIDYILEIGKIIHHDFRSEITELHYYTFTDPVGIADNGPEDEHSATYWKDKYLVLLEKYNDLLEKNTSK